jgi:hypothetical protein
MSLKPSSFLQEFQLTARRLLGTPGKRWFLLPLAIECSDEPVRHRDNTSHAIEVPAFLRMLDDMFRDAAIFIKLKDEDATEFLRLCITATRPACCTSDELFDLVHWIFDRKTYTAIYAAAAIAMLCPPACLPFHDQFLVSALGIHSKTTISNHAFGEYTEFYIAN